MEKFITKQEHEADFSDVTTQLTCKTGVDLIEIVPKVHFSLISLFSAGLLLKGSSLFIFVLTVSRSAHGLVFILSILNWNVKGFVYLPNWKDGFLYNP